jgi:hypothetical protein
LNERLTQDYGMSFDADAMVHSDLADGQKFHPPDGRFDLVPTGTTGSPCSWNWTYDHVV